MTRLEDRLDALSRRFAQPMRRRRALAVIAGGFASMSLARAAVALAADCENEQSCEDNRTFCVGATACGFTGTNSFGCKTCNLQCCYGGSYAKTSTVCCEGTNSAGQAAKWCCGPSAPICGQSARDCLRDCKRRCGGDCCESDELCCGNSRETGYCCSIEEATEDSKRICEKYARKWEQEATDNAELAVPLYMLSPVTGALALSTAVVDQLAAEGLFRAADDPPDQNFARVVTPAVRRLPRLKPTGGLDKAGVRAIQALLDNQATAAAMLGAWVTSMERAQGAALADDRVAAEMQVRAAAKFAKAAADGYAKEAVLRVRALKATKGKLGGLRATAAQAEKARSLARRGQLPPGLPAKLTSMGFSAAQQADLRKRIASASTSTLTRGYTLSGLGSSDSLALAKSLERELRAYAATAGTKPLTRSR